MLSKARFYKLIVYAEQLCCDDGPVKALSGTPCRETPGGSLFRVGGFENGVAEVPRVWRHKPRVGYVGVRRYAAAGRGDQGKPRGHCLERSYSERLARVWMNEDIAARVQTRESIDVRYMAEKRESPTRPPAQFQ